MNIPRSAYEKPRHILEFCAWIDAQLALFEKENDFEAHYFERQGENVKKFIEEAIPVSRLGLHLYHERQPIYVQCLTGNQRLDASLDIHTYRTVRHIKVEVTTTETSASTKRRQALARDGFAELTGRVWRTERKIHFEGEMVNVEDAAEQALQLGFDRMRAKVERTDQDGTPYYDAETAILVHVDFFRNFSSRHRAQIIEQTRQYLRSQERFIYGVFYCYTWNQGVDELRNQRQDLW